MFSHPDDALSRDEHLQKIWKTQPTPHMRARVLADAEALGCIWLDIFREFAAEHDSLWADPIERAGLIEIDKLINGESSPLDPIFFGERTVPRDHR